MFSHMAEKIKMRQVEEEYWKFTDTSGVGNATNQKDPLISPTPQVLQGQITSLPEQQKNVIEQWVGDMNSNMLGLQRRAGNISTRVDGRQGGSKNPGISESPEETPLPVQFGLPVSPSFRGSLVQESPATGKTPQNTFIQVVQEESDVWSGTEDKS
jgi:hypothetical protein